MRWRMRVAAAAFGLSLAALAAFSKPVQAQVDCAALDAQIAAAEEPIKRLRALIQSFAAHVSQEAANMGEQGGFTMSGDGQGGLAIDFFKPGYTGAPGLALMNFERENPGFSADLQKARDDAAANEPELQRLRGLKIRHCSGQMARTPSGSTYSPLQQYLPQPQVYGYPAVSPTRPARTTRTYRSRSTTVRSASVKRKASTRKSVRASKPTKARTTKVRARNVRNTRSTQSRQGQRRQAAVKRPQGRTHVAKPGIIRDPPR